MNYNKLTLQKVSTLLIDNNIEFTYSGNRIECKKFRITLYLDGIEIVTRRHFRDYIFRYDDKEDAIIETIKIVLNDEFA